MSTAHHIPKQKETNTQNNCPTIPKPLNHDNIYNFF